MMTIDPGHLKDQAATLKLYGLQNHWQQLTTEQQQWLATWFEWELSERQQRSLQRRLRSARLGRFKPLAEFDWDWPDKIDQQAIHALMQLDFLKEAGNAILIGGNGVGKSTIAQNLAYQAVLEGHTALFITAANMLSDLATQDGDNALRRKLKHYAQPELLVIDEIGYLSYNNRHADLLFEIVNRRYEQRSVVITTNRPFGEWGEVFPGSACVVSLVDRLVHHSEILTIEGKSYRMKEAKDHADKRRRKTSKRGNTA